MRIIWYLTGLLSIFFILLYNPKADMRGSLRMKSMLFNNNKQAENFLEILIWIFIAIFMLLTIYFVRFNY